jgi:flagellar biosynthesis protein FlhG
MFSSFWHTLLASRKLYGFDIVILDLGAGSHRLNVDFFTAAHMGIVTVLPEPTSIENAYSFLKATYRRLIDHAGGQLGQSEEATFLTNSLFDVLPGQERSGQSLAVKFRQEAFKYPELCDHVAKSLSGRQVGLVVNQIRSQKDNGIGESMAQICRHYFGFDSRFLGGLPDDEAAWKSLRNRRLMIKDFPHSNLTKKLYDVTAKLLTHLGY